jgi:hypothetical protein
MKRLKKEPVKYFKQLLKVAVKLE